jgi:hypothetical protein
LGHSTLLNLTDLHTFRSQIVNTHVQPIDEKNVTIANEPHNARSTQQSTHENEHLELIQLNMTLNGRYAALHASISVYTSQVRALALISTGLSCS